MLVGIDRDRGQPIGDKVMDHTKYPCSLKSKTWAELDHIALDASEAMEANPDNLNNSYYADEIAYVANEKRRRNNAANCRATAEGIVVR